MVLFVCLCFQKQKKLDSNEAEEDKKQKGKTVFHYYQLWKGLHNILCHFIVKVEMFKITNVQFRFYIMLILIIKQLCIVYKATKHVVAV